MADEAKIVTEATAELSKPENKAELEQTLAKAFNEGTQPADAKPAAADEVENKGDEDKGQPADDPSKKNAGEADKKPNRFEELLADRNAAKIEAAEKQTEVQTLTKQVEVLTKAIEGLKAGNGGEGADADDSEGADDKPMTKKEVDAYLERKLNERNAASDQSAAAEKSITEQIQALETKKGTPNAKEYTDELKAVMAKHPSITAYMAYRSLQGEGIIPIDGATRSNANRTGTGGRSKTNLLDTKNPESMTQAELLAQINAAHKSGDLKL